MFFLRVEVLVVRAHLRCVAFSTPEGVNQQAGGVGAFQAYFCQLVAQHVGCSVDKRDAGGKALQGLRGCFAIPCEFAWGVCRAGDLALYLTVSDVRSIAHFANHDLINYGCNGVFVAADDGAGQILRHT